MHVGKHMARLNPTTIRYDTGRGGVPDLTPQDIAAAVAMVPAGLGRELLCRIWWPDGAKLTSADLDRALMDVQLQEWRDRYDALLNAQLKEAYARNHIEQARARAAIEAAKAKMWPRIGPQSCYAAIRKAVLVEMSAACRCQDCDGNGADAEGIACDTCQGIGRKDASDRARAEMIDRDPKTYREGWAEVYEWTIARCNAALAPAHAQFRRAVA